MKKIIKYQDPFMGEIELTELFQTTKHMQGETRMDTLYSDGRGNIYIETGLVGQDFSMTFIRKEIVDAIKIHEADFMKDIDNWKPLTKMNEDEHRD